MAKTPENDARLACQTKANDIARLMDVLQMELERRADEAQADPKNWARVGDIGKVRSDLIQLVGFLSGKEPDLIEQFLAE